jgi:peptide/nickel transport system substrate-binding protein
MYVLNVNGVDCIDPSFTLFLSNGESIGNGGSTNAAIEAEIAAWYAATSPEEEQRIARRLNKLAFDHVIHAPLGMCVRYFACRKSLTGVKPGPVPFPWGVSKTA